MLPPFGKFASALLILTLLALLMVVPAQKVGTAQEAGVTQDDNSELGLFGYAGGAARAKRARTQTATTTIPESVTWVNLPSATLTFTVPTLNTALFNVAFSAVCRLVGSVPPNDWVRIRVLDNGVPMEPYDGNQPFCSANGYATHKGNWVKRVQAGLHTLQVQFWIQDGLPLGVLSAAIKDWTFELVVYE